MEPSLIIILLPFAIILLIAGWIAISFRRDAVSAAPGPGGITPYGVHGWLRLFIFASYYLAPLIGASRLNSALREAEERSPQLLSIDGWTQYKTVSWLLLVSVIVWQWWVAYGLKHRFEPRSVFRTKVLICSVPLISLADLAAAKVFLRTDVNPQAIGAVIGAFLAASIMSLVWFLYFTRSKRVDNTYNLIFNQKMAADQAKPKENRKEEFAQDVHKHPTSVPNLTAPRIDSFSSETANDTSSIEVRLEALKRMLDRGLITQEDFELMKSQLLRNL